MENKTLFRLFHNITLSESTCVIGVAKAEKNGLINSLRRKEVQKVYLQEKTLIIRVDLSKLTTVNELKFFELIFHSLLTEASLPNLDQDVQEILATLQKVKTSKNLNFLEIRFLERAISILVRKYGIKLCIILDGFDKCYQEIHPRALAILRAIRDDFKYSLCYIIFFLNFPKKIRSEAFYELISKNIISV